jgi:riboflavin synthase
MFTGLIEHLGSVVRRIEQPPGCRLEIDAGPVAINAQIGDSISINGCCLTVVAIEQSCLAFEAGAETLGRTNLGALKAGARVNLERSLRVGDRMGGHFVTGHIDGVGYLDRRVDDPPWAEFWFRVPEQLTQQMAPKGSIAVDGVSLTLVQVTSNQFSVALIPHTLAVTRIGQLAPGDAVNIETDVLAKYVAQQLHACKTDKPIVISPSNSHGPDLNR